MAGWFDNTANLTSFTTAFVDGTTWSAAQLAPQNREPVPGAALSDQTALEDEPWSFQLPDDAFLDPDPGDTLVYAAQAATGGSLPDWLAFDSVTRTFSGTPLNAHVGEFSVQVNATDDAGASATMDFLVRVANVNDAPVVQTEAAGQRAAETRAFAVELPQDLFSDEDAGDSLTWTVQQAGGEPLPPWLVFDPQSRVLQGTPALGAGGTWPLSVTATDSAGLSATQSFALAVSYAPRAGEPVAPQTAAEDASWTFTLPEGALTDSDPDDTLSFAASSLDGGPLPAWLSFDATTRVFSGTPANDDVGLLDVTVTATDTSGASADTQFRLEVLNVNDAPVVSVAMADQQAVEDVPWLCTIAPGTFADVDANDRLAYSARLADGAALPSWMQFDATTQSFSGTPANENVGTLALTVTAADLAGATADVSFTVAVANVNDAPLAVGPLPAWAVVAGDAFTYVIPQDTFADVDAGDQLALSAMGADGQALPAWLAFDAATRTLTGLPAASDAGDLTLSVTATDLAGASASQSLLVDVKPGLTLSGTSGADTLTGRAGNDSLDGGAGADRMAGGKGDDTYFVSERGDTVIELADEGIDSIHSAVSCTLPANVEQLFLDGSARGA
ncbi:MAG TPA: putative Ig domain-containing protein, partial [Ramlibacter sp.]|nr:putative Ig domain-containing protein [Ramlibacter sp.]